LLLAAIHGHATLPVSTRVGWWIALTASNGIE
jgi:hypothetical protein